jgi:hypothetical protein
MPYVNFEVDCEMWNDLEIVCEACNRLRWEGRGVGLKENCRAELTRSAFVRAMRLVYIPPFCNAPVLHAVKATA